MQKQKGLLEIGIGLLVIGLVVQVILALSLSLRPLANLAIGSGLVLAVIGLLSGQRLR